MNNKRNETMTHTHTNFAILLATRTECNESEAKNMEGCIIDGEKVIAYFPTLSAMKNAKLFAAAPDLLDALEDAEFLLRKAGNIPGPMQDSFKRSASDARAAIAKARGGA